LSACCHAMNTDSAVVAVADAAVSCDFAGKAGGAGRAVESGVGAVADAAVSCDFTGKAGGAGRAVESGAAFDEPLGVSLQPTIQTAASTPVKSAAAILRSPRYGVLVGCFVVFLFLMLSSLPQL
jgi:hypothetical protein